MRKNKRLNDYELGVRLEYDNNTKQMQIKVRMVQFYGRIIFVLSLSWKHTHIKLENIFDHMPAMCGRCLSLNVAMVTKCPLSSSNQWTQHQH